MDPLGKFLYSTPNIRTFCSFIYIHRVASIAGDLCALVVDPRSTAAFGLAHVFAALTVTNRELQALALAEKEMTVEQYEQMKELQRIKARDEQGNAVEERREEEDLDTLELCKLRIRKLAGMGAIKTLVR
jgi:hypothetical protein